MNAQEARRITDKQLRGEAIFPYLEHVHQRIRRAAIAGQGSIVHPFHGVATWPGPEVRAAVFAHLIAEGYTVAHHDSPDPGNPLSSDYEEVSW